MILLCEVNGINAPLLLCSVSIVKSTSTTLSRPNRRQRTGLCHHVQLNNGFDVTVSVFKDTCLVMEKSWRGACPHGSLSAESYATFFYHLACSALLNVRHMSSQPVVGPDNSSATQGALRLAFARSSQPCAHGTWRLTPKGISSKKLTRIERQETPIHNPSSFRRQ